MDNSHAMRNFLLTVVGLIVVGALAWWLLAHIVTLIIYVAVGAVVVGGAVYLVGRARRPITRGGRRSIGR